MNVIDWLAGQGFLPHGVCFQWSPTLLGLMVGSNALTAAAYFSIPVTLIALVRQRSDLRFNWIFVLFSAFIFLCGMTHVVHIATIWWPAYWFEALTSLVTGVVSAFTAVALWMLLPKLLAVPSNEKLEALVARLETEVKERRLAEEQLGRLTAELEQRVEARTAELREALVEQERLRDADLRRITAEQANKAKSDFLSRMSHELRTPLNAVIGFSQLLRQGGNSASERAGDWLGYIQSAGQTLLKLVEDILDISRIESGKLDLQVEPVALDHALDDCVNMLSAAASAKGVTVEADAPTGRVVLSDTRRLKQVLTNLLSNAVKYTLTGGRVVARLRVDDARLHIEVEDTGIGMTPKQRERLFEPFNRLGRERSQEYEGAGLGLVVVKQLVDALGGHIEVDSEVDRGTRFRVALPVRFA